MTEPQVTTTVPRWEWDRSKDAVVRVLGRAKAVTWTTASLLSLVLVSTGWALTSGILRHSAVIYGVLAGIAGGYLVRGLYVATCVRRAVAPVQDAVVPAAVREATEAQLVSLLVNGGSMFRPYVHLKAVEGDAVVEIVREDLAERDMPRPGFWQLLLTGPDGTYHDDGSGTMSQPADGGGGAGGGADGGGLDGGS